MKALYRKYRSRSLEEVVGQEHITDVLRSSLKGGRVSHAYLFVGPRGTGKTSVARILAHAVNGFKYELEDSYLDIIEIDAASNTGVDNIRDLREKAMVAPAEGKYKVYIIDEVHMLSKSAFNALLKTLEEPPEHVIFIMATTDAHKVPITIVSRSQKFVFRLADEGVMYEHLRKVAEAEGIKIDEGALRVIARRSGGSFRDAMSLLDQISIMSEGEITAGMVEEAMGLPEGEGVERILEMYLRGDVVGVTGVLGEMRGGGVRAELVASELMERIVGEPRAEYMGLLDKLTEVGGSGFPEVKLLLALVGGEASSAVSVSPGRDKRSTQGDIPMSGLRAGGPPVSSAAPLSASARRDSAESAVEEVSQTLGDTQEAKAPVAETELTAEPVGEVARAFPGEFDWGRVVEGVRGESAGLAAHLARLDVVVMGDKVVIYGKTKFIKGIVDKGMAMIVARVPEGMSVEVVEGRKPVEDEKLRKISDIMGGIEEVKVDD